MLKYTQLLQFLRSSSYEETAEIHHSANFLVRGDTISWWPINHPYPYRHHFFGEELEKIEVLSDGRWQSTVADIELWPNTVETEHGTIRPQEYLVHPFHGVGIFERIETREVEGEWRHFTTLRYAGEDKLLFPLERHKELMPYIGSRHPRLTRLYSKSWQNTKEKVQKDLIKVARELLKIYAARQLTKRPAYPVATDWQQELERGVDFELTEDQGRAWRDIQNDLQSPHPMDRLVCGDVGYGKTEVALRAAAQVLAAGKQVALIAPTTVLAEQHYTLVSERFRALPVKVEHMSRLTAQRNKEVGEKLGEGSVDMVVGTHRLLGKDINFKNLGLLILDEEQKFGVDQKELLKKLRPHIDVLSLSATPIPRTLSMSLSGLRGLSILRTAPQGRQPVQTEIINFSNIALEKALDQELQRAGQLYIVHNRVQSLGLVQKRVEELVRKLGYTVASYPEEKEGAIVIAPAHGQMSELVLAETMSRFLAGKIQILVASSIVEHGLDSPHANTLVVLHSEWFGLSDLYQLRGRVGRRRTQAYAYFMIGGIEREAYIDQQEFTITETARKRLQALKEADTLGSGWSIAMRDLEIRGGGNILGHEQHGSMEAIGLLLYAQLLQEEIGRQAKGLNIPLFQKTTETE